MSDDAPLVRALASTIRGTADDLGHEDAARDVRRLALQADNIAYQLERDEPYGPGGDGA